MRQLVLDSASTALHDWVFLYVKINDFGAVRLHSRVPLETPWRQLGKRDWRAHDPDPGRRRRSMPRLSEGGGAQREAAQ